MADYTDMTGVITYRRPVRWQDLDAWAENDAFHKQNGWEDNTVGVFFQAAAPTGWTKITTQNAKALRVVSTAGGTSGGSADPATEITLAHTHTVSAESTHDHDADEHVHYFDENPNDSNPTDFPDTSDQITFNSNGWLRLANSAGGLSQDQAYNEFETPDTPITSGASDTHDHGGTTDSQLTSITLAHANVIFCSKDTSSGYTNKSTDFAHREGINWEDFEELAENDKYLNDRLTPATTVSLFFSALPPTGWTKVTTQNGKLLRITSGSGGGTGGSYDPSSTIVLAHTHGNLTAGGAHTHTIPNHVHELMHGPTIGASNDANLLWANSAGDVIHNATVSGGAGVNVRGNSETDGGGSTTDPGNHQHATGSSLTSITLAHLNVIQASKDSAGAPDAYTDLTTFFADDNLLAYQEGEELSKNDSYINFHTMRTAALMFFFQTNPPTAWTKKTDHTGKLLRIVSGLSGPDGGTSGGSTDPGDAISLAHTHSIDSKSHTHTYQHDHNIETGNVAVLSGGGGNVSNIYGTHGALIQSRFQTANTIPAFLAGLDDTTLTMESKSHDHGGATGSALSNVTLAHVNVLLCQKN